MASFSHPQHIVIGCGPSAISFSRSVADLHGVLILEGGPILSVELAALSDNPNRWGEIASKSLSFSTVSQRKLHGRNVIHRQGNGAGGSSSVNAMIWCGGHHLVYDRYWPSSWNSQNISRWFY